MFGLLLYIAAVSTSPRQGELPAGLSFFHAEQRVAFSSCKSAPRAARAVREGIRVPSCWGKEPWMRAFQAVPCRTVFCRMWKFAVLTLVTCAISDTHTARYNMSDGMKGPSSVDDRGLNP